MTILDTIISEKRIEVAARKSRTPLSALQADPALKRKGFSLAEFLKNPSRTGIIAEYKRRSPSKGVINDRSTVEEVTAAYAKDASGISVLTDEKFFGGSLEDLRKARGVDVPLLRKDFMIDPYQVVEAKANGADVILLIAACLTREETAVLAAEARALDMEVLLEIHDDAEIEYITDDIQLVGVNNRNLKTFEVDIQRSLDLIRKIPAGKTAIAESGISDVSTIVSLRRGGFKGFLIGENFMKAPDPAIAFAEFVARLKSKDES